MTDPNDKTYANAAGIGLGRALGGMLTGMLETGFARAEALEVVEQYAYAIGSRPDAQDLELTIDVDDDEPGDPT